MPRWTSKLVFYLLLPYLVAVPLLVGAGYLLARRAVETASNSGVRSVALQQARAIAAHLPRDAAADVMENACRDQVRGSASRLTVIAADGHVLCDSAAEPASMVNHLSRPEVGEALRSGEGFAQRESATVHYPTLYAAVRIGDGGDARVVRVAIPADVVGVPGRFALFAALVVLATVVVAFLPAGVIANRIGGRVERMIGFSRAVAAGDFSSRMPAERHDELGALETNLNDMAEGLRASFRVVREESDKVQGILRAMVEGVVVIARGGEVILINQRAEEIFNLASGPDYRGRHLVEMCRDPELQDLLRALVSADGVHAQVHEIALADAEHRFLAVTVSPLGEPHRPRTGFVLVFHDITDLKKLETMRRDFVDNVSHELRTPLTAIRGYAETLLTGALEEPGHARQFLSVIERHSERLSRLIDDLLTLSDLELGKTPLKRGPVQLDALVHETLEVVGEKARRGNVTLATALDPDVPPLFGDADRLQQVLINLVDNAVKYTPAGGSVTITASPAANGAVPMVDVEVSDTGVGIPHGDLPRLTERFYRVDKARSRELGGTGLGLAIVKHIVQAHEGRLQITSELNVGTRVRFSVPAWVAAERAAAAPRRT